MANLTGKYIIAYYPNGQFRFFGRFINHNKISVVKCSDAYREIFKSMEYYFKDLRKAFTYKLLTEDEALVWMI